LINESDLYQVIIRLFIQSTLLLYHHDDLVSAKSSYDAIRKILLFCMAQPIESRKNIASKIIKLTNLSRSRSMSILRELKAGGYISMDKGTLISINKKLPDKY
ncbi:helix-turn-helix domain-containing protein, partial [Enterobacter roggenkampii]|uniref:helix-turn-helix domain-containing protein n=1 Tax=Enterobacter roggenkampii TaxID=1812935 RepID=UPI0019623ED3